MAETKQFCTFYLDNLFFGVGVEHIQEVLRYHEMTPVPLAPDVIEGFINLRGQIVPALDLRRRLNVDKKTDGVNPMNVVVTINGEVVSLLVDKIGDVLDVDDSLFETPPETLSGNTKEVIHGAYKLEERLLLVLNIEKVLEIFTLEDKEVLVH